MSILLTPSRATADHLPHPPRPGEYAGGWELWDTGGGCTAWGLTAATAHCVERPYALITTQGDPTHPPTMDEPVMLGLYAGPAQPGADDADPTYLHCRSVDHAVDITEAWLRFIYGKEYEQ